VTRFKQRNATTQRNATQREQASENRRKKKQGRQSHNSRRPTFGSNCPLYVETSLLKRYHLLALKDSRSLNESAFFQALSFSKSPWSIPLAFATANHKCCQF
jgi:hypothetical protein